MWKGRLVKYIHWQTDPLLSPQIKFGIVLTNPNEVGNMQVAFGTQKMWVWCGDLEFVNERGRESN